MLWTLNVEGFRDAIIETSDLSAVSTRIVAPIREMSRPDPNERASAAQMLIKCFLWRRADYPTAFDPLSASPHNLRTKLELVLPIY
jgi:hypothetical protein